MLVGVSDKNGTYLQSVLYAVIISPSLHNTVICIVST